MGSPPAVEDVRLVAELSSEDPRAFVVSMSAKFSGGREGGSVIAWFVRVQRAARSKSRNRREKVESLTVRV
jgi:hypothetical protein